MIPQKTRDFLSFDEESCSYEDFGRLTNLPVTELCKFLDQREPSDDLFHLIDTSGRAICLSIEETLPGLEHRPVVILMGNGMESLEGSVYERGLVKFSRSAIHEANNQLTGIISYASLYMAEPSLDLELRETFEVINNAGQECAEILKNSRPERHSSDDEASRCRLDDVIKQNRRIVESGLKRFVKVDSHNREGMILDVHPEVLILLILEMMELLTAFEKIENRPECDFRVRSRAVDKVNAAVQIALTSESDLGDTSLSWVDLFSTRYTRSRVDLMPLRYYLKKYTSLPPLISRDHSRIEVYFKKALS